MFALASLGAVIVLTYLINRKEIDEFSVIQTPFADRVQNVSSRSLVGRRDHQEDRMMMEVFGGGRFLIAGLFDGHGSNACSEFLKQRLPIAMSNALTGDISEEVDHSRTIQNACMRLHQEWQNKQNTAEMEDFSGSTLTGIVLDYLQPTKCYTFNLGDSQTLLYGKETGELRMTANHDLSPARVAQVYNQDPDASIIRDESGIWRIAGYGTSLNLSGAFGNTHDAKLHRSLLQKVEVVCHEITEETQILIGSDGLEDFTPERLIRLITQHGMDATRLASYALKHGPKGDNISCILLTIQYTLPLA